MAPGYPHLWGWRVCVGEGSVIGAGVQVAPGRSIPPGVNVVPGPHTTLTRIPSSVSGTMMVQDGTLEPL